MLQTKQATTTQWITKEHGELERSQQLINSKCKSKHNIKTNNLGELMFQKEFMTMHDNGILEN